MATNTWRLVPHPSGANIVNNKWVYRINRKSDGTIDHYKARLVAKGFHQRFGVSFHETFSPVMKTTNIRIVLAFATTQNWLIHQLAPILVQFF